MIPIVTDSSISFDVHNSIENEFRFTGYNKDMTVISNFYGNTNPLELLEGYVSYESYNNKTTVVVKQIDLYEGGSRSLCYISMYPDNKYDVTVNIILI